MKPLDTLTKALEALAELNLTLSTLDPETTAIIQETILRYTERSEYLKNHFRVTLAQTAPISIGCWVTTIWGQAVVTRFDRWGNVEYRYQAERNGKTVWVGNSHHPMYLHYLREPDDVSAYVLTLKGPYGDE